MPSEAAIRSTPRSTAFTSDFTRELAAETSQLLVRRYVWFSGVVGALWLFHLVRSVIEIFGDGEIRSLVAIMFDMTMVIAYGVTLVASKRGRLNSHDLSRLTIWMVVLDAAVRVLMGSFGVPNAMGVFGIAITHVLAACFLPWRMWDAIKSALLIVGVVAIDAFLIDRFVAPRLVGTSSSMVQQVTVTTFSMLFGVPGILIAWAKDSRRVDHFRMRFLQRRYGELRRELTDARRIHESLFPPQQDMCGFRFRYRYEPMRQIGGDYLYATSTRTAGGESMSLVLIDVTGHGIPAALTVNRLHGELERLFAEHPEIDPGEVLSLLNRYVHLTLARHSVYVTAFCARVNQGAGTLEYASGGHPPAFVRTVDKRVHELPATTFVLGAAGGADFESSPRSMMFGPGDTLIAYTDGAIEARAENGTMLGIQGLLRVIASAPPERMGWAEHLLRVVDAHRAGPPADDTLIVEITRSVESTPRTQVFVRPAEVGV